MCISKAGQIVYGGLAIIAIGLILVSMFTSRWRKLDSDVKDLSDVTKITSNIFEFTCADASSANNSLNQCTNWFKGLTSENKVIYGAMIVALLCLLVASVWNVLTFFSFCTFGEGYKPLIGLATTAAVFLAIALGAYYHYKKDVLKIEGDIELVKNNYKDLTSKDSIALIKQKNDVGYSFYAALGALVVSLANAALGFVIEFFGKSCL